MADAASKVTFIFQFGGPSTAAGWTENFYSPVSPSAGYLKNLLADFVPLRVPLLGVGAFLQAIRISNVPANRVTYAQFVPDTIGKPINSAGYPPMNPDTDPTQVDLLCRAQTGEGKRRSVWIAGLPDSETDTGLKFGIVPAYINSATWKKFVTGVTTNFLIRWKSGTDPITGKPIYTATPIVSLNPEQVRNRKRGRPFDLYRGRRLA
jgi:hypothetical protein